MPVSNRTVYAFDTSKLRRGDILLSTHSTSVTSKFIRFVTRSRYSHAAICFDSPFFIEAVGTGVSYFHIGKYFVKDKKRIAILRLKNSSKRRSTIAESAAEESSFFVGKKYSIFGYIQLQKQKPRSLANTTFCSHLVANCYAIAGLYLLPHKALHRVSPNDLTKSGLLEDVTNQVLQPSSLKFEATFGRAIEENSETSPNQRKTLIEVTTTNKMNTWLISQGLVAVSTFYELLILLGTTTKVDLQKDIDKHLFDIMNQYGYIQLLDDEIEKQLLAFQLPNSFIENISNVPKSQLEKIYLKQTELSHLLLSSLEENNNFLQVFNGILTSFDLASIQALFDVRVRYKSAVNKLLEGNYKLIEKITKHI
jgi:uncharacterized protein YycO